MDNVFSLSIRSRLQEILKWHVEKLLLEAGVDSPPGFRVEATRSTHREHGDYSTNAALLLAKPLRKSPLWIAQELMQRMLDDPRLADLVIQVEVAGPGFVNFHLGWGAWESKQVGLLEGTTIKKASPLAIKAVIEHTSVNPNKSMHIGHLRNSCIGDTLARMLKVAGYQVEVHNYIDDLGNQLADTVVGLLHLEHESSERRFGDFCWETYAKVTRAYQEQPELQRERTHVLQALEAGRSNLSWMGTIVAERIVREHLEEMQRFGIGYDVLVWESQIVHGGFWQAAFEKLLHSGAFFNETSGKHIGCWVLKTERESSASTAEEGDYQVDKVLVRSNGILTYTAKDIAYHLWKFGLLTTDFTYRKFNSTVWTTAEGGSRKKFGSADLVVNVIDHRQEYPQLMVREALRAMGYEEQADQLRHVSYGVVSLSPSTAAGLGINIAEGKGSYAMSGRQGVGIKVSELLDSMEQVIDRKRSRRAGLTNRSIAAAAVRYYLLRFHLQTEIVFDMEQASEVSGNSGIYLMYAYARSTSILEKAKTENYAYSYDLVERILSTGKPSDLPATEHALVRHIQYWPDVLEDAVNELSPSSICTYAYELSSLFSHFYAACPILRAEDIDRSRRLWMVSCFNETLGAVLGVLGLPAPKKM
ncbi:MAG: arginine--tRNA ligase [Gorillibacterium sp.]|nr:arginine--tRNA ligase [Gorillibacterium sp.]